MLADGEKKAYVCDDVEYRYSESTKMLYIWVSNDDRYYKQPKRAAKYDFGRRADGQDKKTKLIKGVYREPYLDGWKYTINGKVYPEFVKVVILYAHYGYYTDEQGNRRAFTNLRHNRKALGIHYLIERCLPYLPDGNERFHSCPESYKVPFFPTPQSYTGFNPQPGKDASKNIYKYWAPNRMGHME